MFEKLKKLLFWSKAPKESYNGIYFSIKTDLSLFKTLSAFLGFGFIRGYLLWWAFILDVDVLQNLLLKSHIRLRRVSNLSGEQVRRINELNFADLSNLRTEIVDALPKFEKSATVLASMNDRLGSVEKSLQDMRRLIISFHREPPPPTTPKQKGKYPESDLAEIYVNYVLMSRNSSPTQIELANDTHISQSTWSRAFNEISFWESVRNISLGMIKDIEAEKTLLIESQLNADDISEKLKYDAQRDKIIEIDEHPSWEQNLRAGAGRENVEDEQNDGDEPIRLLDQKIDLDEKMKKMDKAELKKTILEMNRAINPNDLDKFDEDTLRFMVLILTFT